MQHDRVRLVEVVGRGPAVAATAATVAPGLRAVRRPDAPETNEPPAVERAQLPRLLGGSLVA
jgi:hypothetical protein